MSNKKEGMLIQQKEHGFVPKLRFPEFWGAAAWKFVPLSKQAKRCTQKNSSGAITRVLTNSAEYGVVDQRDYFDKEIATQGNLESYYVVEKGDYVYNPRISTAAPVGPISKNNVATGVMSPLYSVFRFNDNNNDFYAYYFKTTGWHQYMRQASSTGARHDRMAITNDDFMAMPLPASTPEEQQKIADCLASLDDLIALEAKKLDVIKEHKKGLMQQLFTAEGETLPKLRFPEFWDSNDWTERELGPMTTKVGSGITPTGGDKNYTTEGRPFVRSQNIGWGELILEDVAFIDEETHRSFDSTEIRANDVLLNITGASIGRSAIADSRIAGGNVNQHVCIIRTKSDDLNHTLLNQFIISERGQKQIDSFQAGGNRQGLNFSQIRSFVIPLPPTEAEQQKIADCLSSLDDVIAMQARKVDALKTHKKGLMQQLFPTFEEIDA